METAKLVVEGAGAVGVAALLGGQTAAARSGTTCVVLSGGNVDAGLLANVARRHETEAGRRLVMFTRVPDRPGSLARLLVLVGESGANLIHVDHLREGIDLHVRETAVQLTIETRGRDHADAVLARVRESGYDLDVMGDEPVSPREAPGLTRRRATPASRTPALIPPSTRNVDALSVGALVAREEQRGRGDLLGAGEAAHRDVDQPARGGGRVLGDREQLPQQRRVDRAGARARSPARPRARTARRARATATGPPPFDAV